MKFLKEGFDVFVLASFEDKSGCRILDFWGLSKICFGKPDRREVRLSSFDKTKAQMRVFISSKIR